MTPEQEEELNHAMYAYGTARVMAKADTLPEYEAVRALVERFIREARPRWIDVKERLPTKQERDENCIEWWHNFECCPFSGRYEHYDGKRIWVSTRDTWSGAIPLNELTHWRIVDEPIASIPMPELPKEEGGEMSKHKPTRGCNLCAANARAARRGQLKEPFDCGACLTSYKASKKKGAK